jgi:hypothetical protein
MLPKPSAKYMGKGPLTLAKLTHQFEDSGDDIEFLAVQDAVATLTELEQRMFREQYIFLHRRS